LGTIIPQATASGSISEWMRAGAAGLFNGLLVTGGAICALLAFRFAAPKRSIISGLWNALVAPVGRAFLLAAFGAAFAAALTASLSVLTGRIDAILNALRALIGG
jgi:hypothetical protein